MNVFVVPSWYPSPGNPVYGIFVKEQLHGLARNQPQINLGASVWGQGNKQFLLWGKDHLNNIPKIWSYKKSLSTHTILSNLKEYHNPQLIWSRRIMSGNLTKIIKANLENLKRFEHDFGPMNLIHVHSLYPGILIAHELKKISNVPVIVTINSSPFPFEYFLNDQGKLVKFLSSPLSEADHIIAVSTSLEERVIQLGFPKTSVIHNMVDTEFFKNEHDQVSSTPQFVGIGRLVDQKAFHVLIEAFSKLAAKYPDLKLKLIGEGDLRGQLQKQVDQLNLNNQIQFTGELNRSAIKDAINDSTALILSSNHETFGIVLAEAISCGKPVLATRCGGPEDIVNDTNGFLVDIGSTEQLAEKMEWILENVNHFNPKAIRQDCIERFSQTTISKKIAELYESTLAK